MATLRSLGCDKVLGLSFPSSETKDAKDRVPLLAKGFGSNTVSLHTECPDNTEETDWLTLAVNSDASKVSGPLKQQTVVRLHADSVVVFGLGCGPWQSLCNLLP